MRPAIFIWRRPTIPLHPQGTGGVPPDTPCQTALRASNTLPRGGGLVASLRKPVHAPDTPCQTALRASNILPRGGGLVASLRKPVHAPEPPALRANKLNREQIGLVCSRFICFCHFWNKSSHFVPGRYRFGSLKVSGASGVVGHPPGGTTDSILAPFCCWSSHSMYDERRYNNIFNR